MSMIPDDATGSRVLVVDDIRLSRDSLVTMLEKEPFIVDVVGVSGVEAALHLLHEHRFEIILLSIATRDSLAICQDLVAAPDDALVIALAVSRTDEEIVACAEAGVFSLLMRDQPYGDLLDVMAGAMRGETSCPPRVAAALMRRMGALAAERHTWTDPGRLTRREREILDLIDRGMSNKEIARRLCIEVRTVKNHVHNLLEKLKVHRRGEAAALLRTRHLATNGRVPLG